MRHRSPGRSRPDRSRSWRTGCSPAAGTTGNHLRSASVSPPCFSTSRERALQLMHRGTFDANVRVTPARSGGIARRGAHARARSGTGRRTSIASARASAGTRAARVHVADIDAPREADASVDDDDLTVIAVVDAPAARAFSGLIGLYSSTLTPHRAGAGRNSTASRCCRRCHTGD